MTKSHSLIIVGSSQADIAAAQSDTYTDFLNLKLAAVQLTVNC